MSLPTRFCFRKVSPSAFSSLVFNKKPRKEWLLCLANKTLPSLVLCPHSENTVQRQFWWDNSLRVYEQDHNSLLCFFPKDFLDHFLIQSGTTLDSRLNLDSMLPKVQKNPASPPSSYCWLCNPHSTHPHHGILSLPCQVLPMTWCLSRCNQVGWGRSLCSPLFYGKLSDLLNSTGSEANIEQ